MFKLSNKITKKYFPTFGLILFFIVLIFGMSVTCSHTRIYDNSTLKFAQISDVHLDFGECENKARMLVDSKHLLEDAIDQINSVKNLDFVLFSGDMINKPIESYFTTFLGMANSIKAPWYLVMGNHDIGINSSFNKARFLELYSDYNKNFKGNKSYYSFVPKRGYIVIVMDGVIDSKITANGYFNRQQLNWLDNTLRDYKNSKAIIVQHFPVVEPFKSETHRVKNAKEYLSVLNKHKNVLLVLSGHYHTTKITRVGNTIHVSTPALVEYPDSFRIITISNKNNHIAVNFKFMETNLKDIQLKSKQKSGSPSRAIGKEEDRNTTIIVNN
jgi:3',5'-cyclic AMP phosphodiesterase CpdA